MATSGSTSFSATSHDTITLSWTVNSQSTSNNTSNITFKVVLKSDSYGRISSTASKAYTATINGTAYSGTNTVGISASSSLTLFTKTLDIAHDSDGSKSFTFSYSQTMAITFNGSYVGTVSGSCTVTPNTIARASSITTANAVTLGNNCSIVWTPASSSFTYTLKFTIGSGSVTTGTISPGTTSAYTYTGYNMAIATWAPYITTATSATCTVVLTTYSSGTSIGTSSKTFTVTVPSSVVPSVSIGSVAEGNSAVTLGVYVQSYSKLTVKFTGTQIYSSSLKSYTLTVGSLSYSGTPTSGSAVTVTSGTLTTSGTITVKVTVTDARGRSASASTTVTVQAYSSPTISSFSAVRSASDGSVDNSGVYVKVAYNYSVSSLNSKNTASMAVKWKLATASSYSNTVITSTSTSASDSSLLSALFSTDNAYTFQISVTDAFTTVTKTVTVSSAIYPISVFYDGNGIAFGKTADTTNVVDIAWKLLVTTSSTPQIRIKNTNGNSQIQITNDDSGITGTVHVDTSGYFGLFNSTYSSRLIFHDADCNAYVGNTTYPTTVRGSTLTLTTSDGSITVNDWIRKTLTYNGSNVGYQVGKVVTLYINTMTPADVVAMLTALALRPLVTVYIPAIISYNSGFYMGAIYMNTTLSSSNIRIYTTYGGGVSTVTSDSYKVYALITYICQ